MVNKRYLITIIVVLVLLSQVLAACDSGSPAPAPTAVAPTSVSSAPTAVAPTAVPPTAVSIAPTSTAASVSQAAATLPPRGSLDNTQPAEDTPTTAADNTGASTGEADTPTPEQAQAGTTDSTGSSNTRAKWTIMVYVAADNNLEPNSIINLMEMAEVGS